MNDFIYLDLFISKLGKYVGGKPVGEWISFPITAEQLKVAFDRIGVVGKDYDWDIAEYKSDIPELINRLSEYENIDELNYLSELLKRQNETDRNKFVTALADGEFAGTTRDIINLAQEQNLNSELYDGHNMPKEYKLTPSFKEFPVQTETLATESPQAKPVIPFMLHADNSTEKLKEVTDRLEQGITEVFESKRYKEYLDIMSKFHNYSPRNTLLISMQMPYASLLSGFSSWKNKFERNVKKGEIGIKIIAPSPHKVKKEMEIIDPKTRRPVLGKDGKPVMKEQEITINGYKVVSVFDVSQTEGKELPSIGVDALVGNVEQYNDFFTALEKISPVPIAFEKIESGAKGYYHLKEKRIALLEDASELQTLKTLIHEIAHAKLHGIDLNAPTKEQKPQIDERTREVETESVAYTVCQHYGLDTSDYSFGYIAGWSSDKALAELKSSLKTIQHTASELINSIDEHIAEIQKEQTHSTPEKQTEIQQTQHDNEKQSELTATTDNALDNPNLSSDDNTFSIYQIKQGDETRDLRFETYSRLQALGLTVNPKNYEHMYTAPLESNMSLDNIFERFNNDHPKGFNGRSLSISDVVVLHQNGQDTAHYIDSFDFKQVPEFFQPSKSFDLQQNTDDLQGIKKLEMSDKSTEQNNDILQSLLPPETQPITDSLQTSEETTQQETTIKYYSINEEAARHAKEANSFSNYNKGSATSEYHQYVDEAIKIAEDQKSRVDPMYHEKIDRVLNTYARKLAENMNNSFAIEARVPSIMIAGGSNFPVGKKEKQNNARSQNYKEFKDIEELLEKIKGIGMGGISSDDPNVTNKLETKIADLEQLQKTMKAVNAYYRKHKTLDGCSLLPIEQIEKIKRDLLQPCYHQPFESYMLSNNNAEIRRLKTRIQQLGNNENYIGWQFKDGKVEANKEKNRLQIFFDEKPDKKICDELKNSSFHWSPTAKAWQRQLNYNAIYATHYIACIQPITGERPLDLQQTHTTTYNEVVSEVSEFTPLENPLAIAEKSTEQDYNLIDEYINNMPVKDKIKKDIDDTKSIFAEKEKKPSILAQLKENKEKITQKMDTKNKIQNLEIC